MPIELESLSEEQLSDGRSQLDQILDTRKQLLGVNHIATGEIEYTIGLFEFFLLGNESNAEIFMSSALATYKSSLGEAHPSTKHVLGVMELVRIQSDRKGSSQQFDAFASQSVVAEVS
jgi:hypothetical protein